MCYCRVSSLAQRPDLKNQRRIVLTIFAVLSNGRKVEAPKPLGKGLSRLRRLSRAHSRKRRSSQFEDLQPVRLHNVSLAPERAGVDVPGVPNHARPGRECSDQPETKYRGLHGNQRLGKALAWLAQQVKPAWSNQELCRG